MNDFIHNQKNLLRSEYKKIRAAITLSRRGEAEQKLLNHLITFLEPYEYVLSFSSLKDEISTEILNQVLQEREQLVLPRVEGDHLKLYHVKNLKKDCSVSKWGILEPDPEKCIPIVYQDVSLALVPGLIFDHKYHRIGYGRGFYDRLLKDLICESIGICFKEQIHPQIVQDKNYDIPCHLTYYC